MNDLIKLRSKHREFYENCAISAMQGIQESGKFGIIADIIPSELSVLSFDIADSMLIEYNNRLNNE